MVLWGETGQEGKTNAIHNKPYLIEDKLLFPSSMTGGYHVISLPFDGW